MAGNDTNKNLWVILNYEIQMYYGVQILQHDDMKTIDLKNKKLFNAVRTSGLTEIKALHTRIMTEMFLNPKRNDDLNVDDLVPEWRADHTDLVDALQTAYETKLEIGESPKYYLDKYLAHATKKRGSEFDWKPILQPMELHISRILLTLPDAHLPMLQFFKSARGRNMDDLSQYS